MREKLQKKLNELLVFRVNVQNNYEKYFEAYKLQRTVLDGIIDTLERLLEEDTQDSEEDSPVVS